MHCSVAALLLGTSFAVHAETCELSRAAEYNATTTIKALGSTPLVCDRSGADSGQLNRCGVLRLFAERSDAFAKLLASNETYKADGGMYTSGYLARWLNDAADDFWRRQKDSQVAVPMSRVCAYLDLSKVDHDKAKPSDDESRSKFLSQDLSLTRDIPDPLNAVGTPLHGPFIVNVTDDRKAGKTTVGVYGTISYKLAESVDGGRWNASATIDSASTDKVEKSSVQVGLDYTAITGNAQSIDQIAVTVSPKYLTDREFKREAYQFSATAAFTSKRFLEPGYYICPDEKTEHCNEKSSAWVFYWVPSLGLEAGHVVDAAGNATLQQIAKEGTYYRLVPGLKAVYEPHWISPKISLSAAYRQRYDLTQGWNRGYAELSFLYQFDPSLYFTTVYRKGRKDTTFDPIDTLFFGFGISQ